MLKSFAAMECAHGRQTDRHRNAREGGDASRFRAPVARARARGFARRRIFVAGDTCAGDHSGSERRVCAGTYRLEARENQAPVSTASLCEKPRKDWRFDGMRNCFSAKQIPPRIFQPVWKRRRMGRGRKSARIGRRAQMRMQEHARPGEITGREYSPARARANEFARRGTLSRERHASATAAEDLRREFGRPPGCSRTPKKRRVGGQFSGRDAGLDTTDSEGLISPVPEDQGIDFAQYFGTKIFRAANGRLRPVLARAAVTFRSATDCPQRFACAHRASRIVDMQIASGGCAAAARACRAGTAVRLARGAKPNRGSARRPLCRPEDSPFLALSRDGNRNLAF